MLSSIMLLASLASAPAGSAWMRLFDGHSLAGWMWSMEKDPPVPSWEASGGELRTTPGKGQPVYLLTRDSFTDFELSFEWNAEPRANSGVRYRFQGYWANRQAHPQPEGPERIEPIALEYQITDDEANPDARSDPRHSCGAIYEYWPPDKPAPARAGTWHTSRIVARGTHIEHWLDGHKVVDLDLASQAAQNAFRNSRRRGSSPLLAKHERRTSPLALQIHDGIVRFRNVRIRRVPDGLTGAR